MTTVTNAAAADRCAQLKREGVVIRTATGNQIMARFEQLHRQGNTIVLVTHEADIAQHAHRVIHVRDGKVAKDVVRPS
jgi:ABC-type ATPase involved in cell division